MTEAAKKARSPIPLLAAVLFVSALGAGVFVGRSIPERRPPATEKSAGSRADPWVRMDRRELASCQERLAAPPEARATSAITDASAEEGEEDAGRAPATVEELEGELMRCKKSEVLINADICSAAGRQFAAMKTLPDDGDMCIQRARAGYFIEDDFDKCDLFEGVPADLSFTQEELRRVMDAVHVRKTIPQEELVEKLSGIYRDCRETSAKARR